MIVNVEDVERMLRERDTINKVPFEEIEWVRKGIPVVLSKEQIGDFKFTGLSNVWFVELRLFNEANWKKS